MPRWRRETGERGIALISVLWIGVALGALAGAVVALSRGDLDLARSQLVRAEAEFAADSAARTAIYALANRSNSAIAADGSVVAWRVGEGGTANGTRAEVRVEVSSEHGRVDLNRAGPALVAALMAGAGAERDEAERLAAAIADFADDDDLLTPLGAERPDYAAAGLPGPKNAPFEREDELLAVLGMPAWLYRRIAGALTVHSGRPVPRAGQEHPLVRAVLSDGPGADEISAPAPLPPAFELDLDAAPSVLRPGDGAPGSDLVRIRAEAETEAGARAARVAVVSLRIRGGSAYSVLAWRQAQPELFPADTPDQAQEQVQEQAAQ